MTADALVARLADCGLDPAELEPKRRLVESTIRSFHTLTGTLPRDAWWVPGRLEVFGKHTDYCGGHSLVATLPRGFIFVAHPREDHVVRLLDARRSEQVDVDAAPASNGASSLTDNDIAAVTGWRRYARVVVRRLLRNFPGAALGADIVFASDLPSASGMSSSSALVVGVVNALAEMSGLKDRSEWRDNVRTPSDAAGYFACFENGLSFGTLAGDGGVGTHGGSEDHVAIVCSGPGQATAWRFVPIQQIGAAAVPDHWTFVIASSGVAAQKIGPALEKYNSVAHRARLLLEMWNLHEAPQASLFAALTSSRSAPDRMREIAETEATNADLEARLEQFIREDVRVLDALEAMNAADPVRLGDLSASSQADAERHLHNQIGETSALVDLARGLGAFAASAFGAGFGGSVWALIARRDAETFAARWLANYKTRFPARTAATTFIARPGPSLMRLS